MHIPEVRSILALAIALGGVAFAGNALAVLDAASQATPQTAKAALERIITMRVDGVVEFDQKGQVGLVTIDTKVPEPMVEPLRKQALGWRFEPIIVDGVPRRARTLFRLVLAATHEGNGYRVVVDSVMFPNPDGSEGSRRQELKAAVVSVKSMPPPAYPADMASVGASGLVVVALRVGSDGKVMDASTVQSVLLDKTGPDRRVSSALAEFERVAVFAARRSHFNVQVHNPGEPMKPLTFMTQYVFLMPGISAPKAGEWRNMTRTPKRAIAWEPERGVAELAGVSDSDMGASELGDPANAVRLAEPVAGSRVL